MKKNWGKKALCGGLIASMALGMCACGGDQNVNADLAKENVYKVDAYDFPDLEGDNYYVGNTVYRDGRIHMSVEVAHWDETESGLDYRLISMKEDGSDLQMVRLEMPASEGRGGAVMPLARDTKPAEEESAEEDEEEPVEDDEADVETEGETGSDEDISVDEPGISTGDEGGSNVWEYTNYYNFILSPEGGAYGLKDYNFEDYSNPEESIVENKLYLCNWGPDGSLQWETELEGLRTDEEYVNINVMFLGEDGSVQMVMTGDETYKMSVDSQGNASERKTASGEISKYFNNLSGSYTKADGTLLLLYADENDWSKLYLAAYDPSTDTVGEPTSLPASFMWDYNAINSGTSADLVYSNARGIYTFNRGNTESVIKMNFINSDMNSPSFSSVLELDADRFFGVYRENYDNGLKLGVFTHVNPEDIPDKQVIVMAGNYVSSDVKRRVVEYNRSNEEYRIVVKEYDSLNSNDDWNAGTTQLNNDIITGNMPDILLADGLPVDNYAAKGLLADVGKLIEEDEELSQVEFVQNVFDAYSVDGKLLYVVPSFFVSTMVAKKSLVGERETWTMADMQQVLDTMPEGTSAMGEILRPDFFNVVMGYCGRDFINVDTGKCDFESQNFLDMMEYAKTLPVQESEESYGEEWWNQYQTQYRDNRTLLCSLSISSMRNISYTLNGRIGEDITYIGFPTESGRGSYVNGNMCFAISSRSRNTEGAWDFLRYYLTDEYQSNLDWGMPVRKDRFMEKAQEATQRPYWIDQETGEKEEYDDNYYLNGEDIVLPPLTQEQLDEAIEFVFSVDNSYYWNDSVANIINEEMDGFYTGQKTAQEVAKVIQSRAQVYVDENR